MTRRGFSLLPGTRATLFALAAGGLLLVAACERPAAESPSDEHYRYAEPNRDGIGKFYMGREISHVMGHRGAGWLLRPEREEEERTDLLLENLPIAADSRVADIGAGSGYFTLPMARMAPDGIVYAVDIQQEMLDITARRAKSAGIENIELVLGTGQDPKLPPDSIDLALFVDAYHEFEWPREVMLAVYESLTPGGQIVLIEYRAEDPDVPILRLHKMSEKQVRRELSALGFEFVENLDILPQQHFLVFRKPAG